MLESVSNHRSLARMVIKLQAVILKGFAPPSAEQPRCNIDRKPQDCCVENKSDQRLRQHDFPYIPCRHAYIRCLHCHTDGEREVQEVPVVGRGQTFGKTQGRLLAIAGVIQPRVVHAENHSDQQPRTDHREGGKAVVQELARGFQIFAAREFEGDGRQTSEGSDAHHKQHQPGIFVFDFSDAFDVRSLGAHGQPEHQDQVSPDAGVPADEDFADDGIGGGQQTAGEPEEGGGRQARVGAGEEAHGDSRW